MPKAFRTLALLLLVAALSVPLAACGKKGPPQPPDENSEYPRSYPTR